MTTPVSVVDGAGGICATARAASAPDNRTRNATVRRIGMRRGRGGDRDRGRGGRGGFRRQADGPRIRFRAQVRNLLNHTQPIGYGSVVTSPLFGQPTGYTGGRTINLSTSLDF